MFFSPGLKSIRISTESPWNPNGILPAGNFHPAGPSRTLESGELVTTFTRSGPIIPWTDVRDFLSSEVLRYKPCLTSFICEIPLSDAAQNHLIRLPHLRTFEIHCAPPNCPTSSLPLGFPPLRKLTVGGDVAHEWFSLIESLENGDFPAQGTAPLPGVRQSLKFLNVPRRPIIDSSFISSIQPFLNLVHLAVDPLCIDQDNHSEGKCVFILNDDDITKLAVALPQLVVLFLGQPCLGNTCATTVNCLIHVSTCCVRLLLLEVHFNTANIVGDFKNLSETPQFKELPSLPRCAVSHLRPGRMPLTLDESGFETVANGMARIFPSLKGCAGGGEGWDEVDRRIS